MMVIMMASTSSAMPRRTQRPLQRLGREALERTPRSRAAGGADPLDEPARQTIGRIRPDSGQIHPQLSELAATLAGGKTRHTKDQVQAAIKKITGGRRRARQIQ
jgi:hypothetical protein